MSTLEGNSDSEKLKSLNKKPYKEQALWFMNVMWKKLFNDNNEENKLKVWAYTHTFQQLDNKRDGNELDEFQAHRFIELMEEPLSVRDMRELLRKVDIDFNKMVSLAEYLICKYNVDWKILVNATMGENTEEVKKAEAMVAEAERTLRVAINRAEEAEKSEKEQLAAEKELVRALAQLQEEENAFKTLCSNLEATKNDMSKGVVSRNKAANELEQLKAKDPMPLQRAKINQAAAVRKAEKATQKAKEQREQAEASQAEASAAFESARKYLDEVSSRVGSCEGTMWWMNHSLNEAKKYLPQSKGGISKK